MFDSHAHLNDPQFASDLPAVYRRAVQAGVTHITNVGYDVASSRRAVELSGEYDGMYATVGLHPHDAQHMSEEVLGELRDLAKDPRVVAIGETGLDYFYDNSPREEQRLAFRAQLAVAHQLGLPVVVHSRDAAQDTLRTIKDSPAVVCVLHCFSGSVEMAESYVAMGHYISIAGPVTFKNARKLHQVVKRIPSDRLMIETDCPYLAPVPHRGKRNEPGYVSLIAERVADLRQMDVGTLAAQTAENTRRFFGI